MMLKPKLPPLALSEKDGKKLQSERLELNIKTIKKINMIYIGFVPLFLLQTILIPKVGEYDALSIYYIFTFCILLLGNVLCLNYFKHRAQYATDKKNRYILTVSIYFIVNTNMLLTFYDLHYGQELSLYILSLMFLCSFLWLSYKEYLLFSIPLIITLIISYIYLYYAQGFGLQNVLPGVVYFIISLAVFNSIYAIRMENYVNRVTLENQYSNLTTESITDPLTGLFNRRVMSADIEKELHRSQGANSQLSILVIDIDRFKSINDKYGHMIGDAVLKESATLLTQSLRENDKIYRFGGEEFVVIMPDTDSSSANIVAENIRHKFERHTFSGVDNQVTASIGIAQSEPNFTADMLFKLADNCLYQAKNKGRNSVVFQS